ncbi:MAG: hypothetical protein MZV63_03465 [Marinilabiliales bacterium]|nr:hypothetical protein [Marinilabiliales bacterium]
MTTESLFPMSQRAIQVETDVVQGDKGLLLVLQRVADLGSLGIAAGDHHIVALIISAFTISTPHPSYPLVRELDGVVYGVHEAFSVAVPFPCLPEYGSSCIHRSPMMGRPKVMFTPLTESVLRLSR